MPDDVTTDATIARGGITKGRPSAGLVFVGRTHVLASYFRVLRIRYTDYDP